MDNSKKIFSDNLKYFMTINNKNRHNLSRDLNISYTTICEWVNGNAMPRSEKLDLLANYFNTTASSLLEKRTIEKNILSSKNEQLIKVIELLAKNDLEKEVLTKITMLNSDNLKNIAEQINYYLYKQDEEKLLNNDDSI